MALSVVSPPFDSNTTGEIKGSSLSYPDHHDWFACSHEILRPMDKATGLAKSKRQHRPLVATKRLDQATPLLQDTLTSNGTIPEIRFLFYRPSPAGVEEHFFTITLTEALISRIVLEQLDNRYPENMPLEVVEHVSFVYGQITWEDVITGVTASDAWRSRRRAG
jgi:type VI secretion system secreted protein Hcp